MLNKIHDLDIYPEYFEPVNERIKNFEIRRNRAGFRVGDILLLREYRPETEHYTGRVISRTITYITDYAQQEGYVVLGIK